MIVLYILEAADYSLPQDAIKMPTVLQPESRLDTDKENYSRLDSGEFYFK